MNFWKKLLDPILRLEKTGSSSIFYDIENIDNKGKMMDIGKRKNVF